MQKLKIADGEIGEEYISKFGKKIQLMSKSQDTARVLVLASDTEVDVSGNYVVFKVEEIEEGQDLPIVPVDDEERTIEHEEEPKDTGSKQKNKPSKPSKNKAVKKMATTIAITAKQLVWDLLKKGPQTREGLAKAILEAGLTENTEVKKVKSYVSVIIANLKRKNKVPIKSLGPGKYRLGT